MNKMIVANHIGFADAEYRSFQMSDMAELTVILKSWENKNIRIVFKHTIRFSYKLGGVIQGLYELSSSSFLDDALSEKYEKIPHDHPFKYFQLEDIDEFPFIRAVAESVNVFKEEL